MQNNFNDQMLPRKVIKTVMIGILVFVVLSIRVAFATGEAQAIYNRTVGRDVSSLQTDMFHSTKGYVDGMVSDLSKYRLELAQEKDATARGAIITHIQETYANFNSNQIQNVQRDMRLGV